MIANAVSQVTPLILTYNEEPNLPRTLDSLRWAHRVVVLDAGSTDGTELITKRFSNVAWHVRPFDYHGAQWEHGIHKTGIVTDYVLALDADMAVPEAFVMELERHFLSRGFSGGVVPFEYWVLGRPLAGSILGRQLRLFKRFEVKVSQGGHTQEFEVNGPVYRFKASLVHDDRKPFERWIASQLANSSLEARRLASAKTFRLRDRLRMFGLMLPVAAVLAYLRAGGPFWGAASFKYACERAIYEAMLAIRLISARFDRDRTS